MHNIRNKTTVQHRTDDLWDLSTDLIDLSRTVLIFAFGMAAHHGFYKIEVNLNLDNYMAKFKKEVKRLDRIYNFLAVLAIIFPPLLVHTSMAYST